MAFSSRQPPWLIRTLEGCFARIRLVQQFPGHPDGHPARASSLLLAQQFRAAFRDLEERIDLLQAQVAVAQTDFNRAITLANLETTFDELHNWADSTMSRGPCSICCTEEFVIGGLRSSWVMIKSGSVRFDCVRGFGAVDQGWSKAAEFKFLDLFVGSGAIQDQDRR